jgi:pimeloyl-ACP methyl ester carboxylesterase
VSTPRKLGLPDGVRRLTVDTARGPFAALEALPAAGVAEHQPALLIPGYTGSKEDFLPVLGPLAQAGRRVIAIDMRGQYESPAAADAGGYDLAALAADVAGIADTLDGHDGPARPGAPRIHLLGHSFGGLVAQELLLGQAARIGSLTLMSSGPGALTGPRAAVLRAILAELGPALPNGLHAEVKRLWDTQLEPAAVADGVPSDVIDFLRTRMLSSCPIGLWSMARGLLACPDRTAALAAAGAPLLVVYGENDDAWAPSIQDDMAQRLGAQRVCIPGAAHSPAVEAPETVASTVTAFWNLVEASRGRLVDPYRRQRPPDMP